MKIFVACVASLLLVLSTGVSARGYDHGYGNHGYGHGYGHGSRHYGYGNYGYRGYRSYGGDAGYFVGGMLLGTLLAPPRYLPQPQVVYVPQPATTTTPVRLAPSQATVSRRLLRDINGNCFERNVDSAGTELRVQLPASECAW